MCFVTDFVTKMHGTTQEEVRKKIACKLNIAQKKKKQANGPEATHVA